MNISNQRILKVLNETSKDFYKNKNNKSQKSNHWKTRYRIKEFTMENLINFRSSNLSSGLDDLADQQDFISSKMFTDIVDVLTEDYVISNLPKNNIGNCSNLIKYKNVYLDYNKLAHICWFNDVEKSVLKNNEISNFCEIGGGFGSFSELFIRNYNLKFLSIDLPEANVLSSYYLKECFPDKKFYLYDNYKQNRYLSYEDFLNNDIIILPPNLNIDPKIKIDLFINSRSFMEMNFSIIKSYFEFIQNHIKRDGFFLNINRYDKTSVGENIRISDYPYDNNWKVITSKPLYNQDWVHFLLTRRNFVQKEQNVTAELEKIKEIGKPFYGKYVDVNPSLTRILLRRYLLLILGLRLYDFLNSIRKKLNIFMS